MIVIVCDKCNSELGKINEPHLTITINGIAYHYCNKKCLLSHEIYLGSNNVVMFKDIGQELSHD